jgi:ABC-2 type transport system permease protein
MSPFEQYTAFMTMATRETRRFLRIWTQTLLPPVITMVLYFVIFGSLIGSRIGQMEGFNYADFVAPGLIMMAVITNSYSNVVSSFFGHKFQRHIEEILVSPTPNYIILAGFVSGGMARGLLVGIFVTITSVFFTDFQIQHPLVVIVTVLLTSALFSVAGLINAVFAKTFDDISIVPTFVLTPLTYLGGVFYSISMLSDFWQMLSKANPILYMVNAFRYGFLGVSDINVGAALVMVFCFTLVLIGIALHLLKTGKNLRA